MAFTKITAAGIGTTETVTVDGLTVINNGSFGGNLTVAGVLTYEDVTNVDSVGLITARNGVVVGSGITLSKDGDVFFTGIATGNGSGLTALNASNLASGTVPTARLGSGTASSSTFLRGDSTFQTVNTDLVSDTSPQLGGDLQSNGNDIDFADGDKAIFGTNSDLKIYHDNANSANDILSEVGQLNIKGSGSNAVKILNPYNKDALVSNANGSIELYHNNSKKFETTSGGVTVTGTLAATAVTGDGSALTGVVAIPSGGIILWSGAANAIPSGFVLCDGNNSTPNLSGKFVVGYDASNGDYDVGDTGGSESVTLTTDQMPSHNHTTTVPFIQQGGLSSNNNFGANYNSSGTTRTSSSTGGGQSHENRPPFYALCYIMKT